MDGNRKRIDGNSDKPVTRKVSKSEDLDTTGRISPDDQFVGWKTGVVKAFDTYSRKGFGFLYDSSNQEYFCHYSNLVGDGYKNLAKGQHVRFMGWLGEKGLYATQVQLVVLGGDPRKKIQDVEDEQE